MTSYVSHLIRPSSISSMIFCWFRLGVSMASMLDAAQKPLKTQRLLYLSPSGEPP